MQCPVMNPLEVYLVTSLTLQGGTINMGQSNPISLSLDFSNGVGLYQRNVRVEIDNSFYQNVTTDNNGHASFNWRPASTGSHTITARFLANTINDIGVEPASGALSVNVVAQTVTNTQASIGTQTVTLNTAQGIAQNGQSGPSVSFQFSLNSITATVHYNGKTAQASSYLNNEFGISCGWLGCWPFWKIHSDTSVSGVFDLHLVGQVLGPASATYSISARDPVDEASFEFGLGAADLIAVASTAAFYAGGPTGPTDAGLVAASGLLASFLVALATLSTESLKSYLLGFVVAGILGIPCALGLCPFEVIDLPLVGLLLGSALLWGNFYSLLAFALPLSATTFLFVTVSLALFGVWYSLL